MLGAERGFWWAMKPVTREQVHEWGGQPGLPDTPATRRLMTVLWVVAGVLWLAGAAAVTILLVR
jgi:hypothetical protein